jgi:hypothetical protein
MSIRETLGAIISTKKCHNPRAIPTNGICTKKISYAQQQNMIQAIHGITIITLTCKFKFFLYCG